MSAAASETEEGDHLRDVLRRGDVEQVVALLDGATHLRRDPPVSVTGGWTTFAVTPYEASSSAADIVKFSSAALAAP